MRRKMWNAECRIQSRATYLRRCVFALLAGIGAVAKMAAQNVVPPSLAGGTPAPEIRDIAPPLDVFPYPLWMVVAAAIIALLLAALLTWLIVRWIRARPAAPPPTAREVALASLRDAQKQIDQLDPYAFSILVSDILREYVSGHYGLRAREQTSPEFLASVANSPRFAPDEKTLLGTFLERCDLIKFAHVDATRDDSVKLLEQARHFVEGALPNEALNRGQTSDLSASTVGGLR
jgi:hypothetical protein